MEEEMEEEREEEQRGPSDGFDNNFIASVVHTSDWVEG